MVVDFLIGVIIITLAIGGLYTLGALSASIEMGGENQNYSDWSFTRRFALVFLTPEDATYTLEEEYRDRHHNYSVSMIIAYGIITVLLFGAGVLIATFVGGIFTA